ncbi:MAG TPA: type II toxin-antitoxin system PemK/MazF family toxin [Humisphaera sp.]|nr:type II toxin-antitoxin system PemK/MazF family toxin [Humisphaera sp.]
MFWFGDGRGHKMRPVAVASIDDIHHKTQIVIVIPGTSTVPRFSYGNVVAIDPDSATNGLVNRTFFQCHQVRAIDQGRITQARLGRLSKKDFERLIAGVGNNFGWIP